MKITLADLMLYPKKLYAKVTDKKLTLILGFILIGFIDLIFTLYDYSIDLSVNKPYNLAALGVLSILLGALDVVFFSLPLFDLYKHFSKEDAVSQSTSRLIRLMKIYIMAHFVIIPINTIIYILVHKMDLNAHPMFASIIVFYLGVIMPIWFSALISRGINVIYTFNGIFKRFVFLTVFIWNFLLSYAMQYMINNWLINLFK